WSACGRSWRDGEVVVARRAEARVIREQSGEEVRVELGPRSYPVVVAAGVLAETGPRLAAAGFGGRCALVTSERVGALYREPVLDSLRAAGFAPAVVEIPDGEEHKNLAWLAVLYDRLLDAGVERRSPLVALGGGVVTDLAGVAALFAELEERLERVVGLEREVVIPVVAACVRYKARVVAEDEQEVRGGRGVLNFGHTVGHALEALTGYKELLHGEAVAIGMVAAARVSVALGRCRAEVTRRLIALLKRAGLPTDIPSGLTPAALALAMRSDKKSTGGRIRFVCLEEIG